jgi:hypothetical protein
MANAPKTRIAVPASAGRVAVDIRHIATTGETVLMLEGVEYRLK